MIFCGKRGSAPLVLSIAAALLANNATGADKDVKFDPGPPSSFAASQTNGKVTVAAKVYESDDAAKAPFGKKNPNRYGILPVLVLIRNEGTQAVRLDGIKVEYVAADRAHVEATPARDIRYLAGSKRPNVAIGPTGPKPTRSKKNPLDTWEIEGRAFSARMIPSGESASGFFYFQTGFQSGSQLYVTGLQEAGTGKEIFYFEVPLRDAVVR